MFSIYRYSLLTASLVAIFCLISWAGEFSAPVESYALIQNGESEIRLLVQFDIPDGVTDSTLTFAELIFGIAPAFAPDSVLRLDCFAVTTPWEPGNVNWDSPWQNPGGDFQEDACAMVTLSANSEQLAYFDLTETVRSWLGGSHPNYGLMFVIPSHIASRYALQRLPNLPERAIGVAKFTTR
jgi:hypothetical protein